MNQNTVTGNENQEKKSRQVLRAEKRKAEKAERHAEIVADHFSAYSQSTNDIYLSLGILCTTNSYYLRLYPMSHKRL